MYMTFNNGRANILACTSGSRRGREHRLHVILCRALVIHGLWYSSLGVRSREVQEQTMTGGQQAHVLPELACMVFCESLGVLHLNHHFAVDEQVTVQDTGCYANLLDHRSLNLHLQNWPVSGYCSADWPCMYTCEHTSAKQWWTQA